ncbi:MAG: hypothetical protein WHS77_01930 [Brevinematales bacterium]
MKYLRLASFLIFFLFFSCGLNELKLAEYEIGGKKEYIKVKDVKSIDIPITLLYRYDISPEGVKNYLIERYILPEFYMVLMIEKGFTNTENFKTLISEEKERFKLATLNKKGMEFINDKLLKKWKYEYVETFFIRFDLNGKIATQRYGNIVDRQVLKLKLKEEIEKIRVELEKTDKNKELYFRSISSSHSDNYYSYKPTEKAYILKRRFDDKMWGENFSKAGRLTKVFEDEGGYTIFYVIKKFKKNYRRLNNIFTKDELAYYVMKDIKDKEVKYNFEVLDSNDKFFVKGKGEISFLNIPKEIVILNISGRDIRWDDIVRVVYLFRKVDLTNLDRGTFLSIINQYVDFMVPIYIAKSQGFEDDKFKKGVNDYIKAYERRLVLNEYSKLLIEEIRKGIREDIIKDFYERNKGRYIVKGYKGDIYMKVRDRVLSDLIIELKGLMDKELMKRYRLVFYERGLKEYVDFLKRGKNFSKDRKK